MSSTTSRARPAAAAFAAFAVLIGGAAAELLGSCGPFTDVTDPTFCGNVLEIYALGITTGTTPTTYSPSDPVSRLQMAIFLSRSVDKLLLRGSRRAVLKQLTTPADADRLALTTVGSSPLAVRSDGTDLWVANAGDGTVSRVRGGDGKSLETRPGSGDPNAVLIAMGQVFVTGAHAGILVRFDPAVAFQGGQVVASGLGTLLTSIAFDGLRIWTINNGGHSVSIVTPGPVTPWTVTTVTIGFNAPNGALFDGSNVWVTDVSTGTLLKLSGSGAVLQTVTVGAVPSQPVFDGTNIWVPNRNGSSISVVRDSTGAVLTTLTGNGLFSPIEAAFDGQRVLVTDPNINAVSLWKATDLTPLGFVNTGINTHPTGACSDGARFWITLANAGELARF